MHEWLGTYEVIADYKGRITLPEEFRRQLPKELLTSGLLEGCLAVCDPIYERIVLAEAFNQPVTTLRLDSFGRINIPPPLLSHANLDDGQTGWAMWFPDRVEIWEKARWDEYAEELLQEFNRFTAFKLN